MDPEEEAETADGVPAAVARLEMFRLTREEMAFQPVPMLPGLARLTAAALDGVPRLRQSGPFSAFTVPAAASDQQWVVRAPTCPLLLLFTCAVPAKRGKVRLQTSCRSKLPQFHPSILKIIPCVN